MAIMAETSDNTQQELDSSSSPSLPPLVKVKALTYLPIHLTPLNYVSWKLQFTSLFFGLDLMGFLDGTTPPPSEVTSQGSAFTPNPEFIH
ncbi:hypothetical protein ACS0TY_011994 [Phlomoides rotata]